VSYDGGRARRRALAIAIGPAGFIDVSALHRVPARRRADQSEVARCPGLPGRGFDERSRKQASPTFAFWSSAGCGVTVPTLPRASHSACAAVPTLKASGPAPCWRNRGFRNYADHMRTGEFRDAIRALLAEARLGRTAMMCAEAVPWRCHRSLIADYLVVVKKRAVEELVGDRDRPHRLSVCARVVRGNLTYDLPR